MPPLQRVYDATPLLQRAYDATPQRLSKQCGTHACAGCTHSASGLTERHTHATNPVCSFLLTAQNALSLLRTACDGENQARD
eukprot:3896969-Pleurochrysis_carterae.AAC.1